MHAQSWPLLEASEGASFEAPDNFVVSADGVRWTQPLTSVLRYACRTEISFTSATHGDKFTLAAWSVTGSACGGVGWDMLCILLAGALLGLLVVLGSRRQLRPLPYTVVAPALEKEETCSICLQACEAPVLLRCKHRFCGEVCLYLSHDISHVWVVHRAVG